MHHRDHHQVIHQALKVQPQVIPLTAATTFEGIHTFDYGDSPYGTANMMTRHQIHARGDLQYRPGEELPKEVDQVRQEADQKLMMKNLRSPKPQLCAHAHHSEHLLLKESTQKPEPHSKHASPTNKEPCTSDNSENECTL